LSWGIEVVSWAIHAGELLAHQNFFRAKASPRTNLFPIAIPIQIPLAIAQILRKTLQVIPILIIPPLV